MKRDVFCQIKSSLLTSHRSEFSGWPSGELSIESVVVLVGISLRAYARVWEAPSLSCLYVYPEGIEPSEAFHQVIFEMYEKARKNGG